MHERGVAGTSTEDVRAAAAVSASQIYHYFADKRSLTRAVIEFQTEEILGFQSPLLANLDDIGALRAWADAITNMQREKGFRGGCPLGSLAGELAEHDDAARTALASGYLRWHGVIRDGLIAMKDRGDLGDQADPEALATTLLTTLQGGLLMCKTLRAADPLETALGTVIDHIASMAA
jgi:AcrR family transcriptional regulator